MISLDEPNINDSSSGSSGEVAVAASPSTSKVEDMHLIGQILSKNSDLVLQIEFVRRRGLSNSFPFPDVDDINDIYSNDVVGEMNKCIPVNSDRVRNSFTFSILDNEYKSIRYISGYNLQYVYLIFNYLKHTIILSEAYRKNRNMRVHVLNLITNRKY
ncbi:hypothetical protein HHI36_008701 [Cryptolaemus montrouzieri]|uniref:Uncharacterized protein n=1 Tax=Cryptolaemus montrouzieri TaxID=559131 RepID=A0ABD2MTC9_9CUCU